MKQKYLSFHKNIKQHLTTAFNIANIFSAGNQQITIICILKYTDTLKWVNRKFFININVLLKYIVNTVL